MFVHVCIDLFIDMFIDLCMDMRVDMRVWTCIDMCRDMCMDMHNTQPQRFQLALPARRPVHGCHRSLGRMHARHARTHAHMHACARQVLEDKMHYLYKEAGTWLDMYPLLSQASPAGQVPTLLLVAEAPFGSLAV